MSLILEALKKSEQQRRLGEAPTLGSPTLLARRRRNALPLLALLIVLAAGAGWWLLRTPQPAPAHAPDGVASAPAVVHPAPAAVAPEKKPAAAPSKPVLTRAHPMPPAPAEPVTPADRAAALARANAQRERGVAVAAPLPPGDRPGAAVPPPASPLTRPHLPPAAKPAATVAAPAVPGSRVAPPASAPAASAAHAAPAPAARPAAVAPAPPLVWTLPYATRKELPDLTLTLHMYAPDPQQRFVVIHGERHVEGDDLGDGVTLHEIRPDGVVLDFKGQRFLYPRDGR